MRAAMLNTLSLRNVGPAPSMTIAFEKRLNLLTGDNGLGKSFLLDIAWWALTRTWPRDINPKLTSGFPARPKDPKKPAWIEFSLTSKTKKVIAYESQYQRLEWTGTSGRPSIPGLVIYAHSDGGFSVWDPERNYWKKKGNIDVQEKLAGFVMTPVEVWDGLKVNDVTTCRGLVDDLAKWVDLQGEDLERMRTVLLRLAPDEAIGIGPNTRVPPSVKDVPTVTMPYGNVPVLHTSSGLRRMLGLAYMLMWSWKEHRIAAEENRHKPTRQIVMLVDEVESHLHPRWQRTILSSLLDVAKTLEAQAEVQLIAATHSPLVLASVESTFDAGRDAWWDLDLTKAGGVVLEKREFERYGDANGWLMSPAFDLTSTRSIEAEKAIDDAALAMDDENFGADKARALETRLRKVLGELDPFWMRWRFIAKQRGWRQ